MKNIATLITKDKLDFPCVILHSRNIFPVGKEVLVYCCQRLILGYVEEEEEYIAELNCVVEFAIIPELDELLKDYVQSNYRS